MKLPILAGLAILATFALAFQQGYPKVVTDKTLYADTDLRGKKAPDFFVEKWLNTSGVDTRGKVVLIDFWATWCPPCRELIPEMNGYKAKFKDKLVVIGISDEPAATVQEFMKKTKMDYSVGIDTKRHMFAKLGVKGIPHVMIISPDGIVRWQGFPGSAEDPLTEKVIQQVIDAAHVK